MHVIGDYIITNVVERECLPWIRELCTNGDIDILHYTHDELMEMLSNYNEHVIVVNHDPHNDILK